MSSIDNFYPKDAKNQEDWKIRGQAPLNVKSKGFVIYDELRSNSTYQPPESACGRFNNSNQNINPSSDMARIPQWLEFHSG